MSKTKNNSYSVLFFIVCVAFLMLSVISAYVSTFILTEYLGLIVGTSLMVVTIPFAIKFKKNKNVQIAVSVLNSIFTGMAISTFYVVKGYSSLTAVLNLIYAALICIVIYALLFLFGKWNILSNHPVIKQSINFALFLGIIAFYVYGFIALNQPLFYSLSTLTIIAFGIYFVSISKIKTKRQLYNKICLSSYCIYIVVAYIVLIFVSEGEAADFGDVFVGAGVESTNSSRKKKSKATLNTESVANVDDETNEPESEVEDNE